MFKSESRTKVATLVLIGLFTSICIAYLTTCGSTEAAAQKPLFENPKQKPKVVADTIPTYIIRIPVLELNKNIDTLNIVMSYIGRSLSVDQSEEVKRLFTRALGNILRKVSLDSTTAPKPRK